ncbi:hypothetical protein ACTFIT_010495 [Dictyostelium discoideum]
MSVNRQIFNPSISPMKNQMNNSPLSTPDSIFMQTPVTGNNRPLNTSSGGINGSSNPLPSSRWAGNQQSPPQQNFGQFGFPSQQQQQQQQNKINNNNIYGQPQSPQPHLRRSSEFNNSNNNNNGNNNNSGGWGSYQNSNGVGNKMGGMKPTNSLNSSTGGVSTSIGGGGGGSKTKYSKDELLNLYDPMAKIPENLISHTHILSEEVQPPINFNFENNLSKSRERTRLGGGSGGLGNNIMNRGIRKDMSHDRMSKPKWANSPSPSSQSSSWRANKDDDRKVWYYLDPQNCTQGPFSSMEMDSWNKAGYFSVSLMVKRGEGNFVELKKLLNAYPDAPFSSVSDLKVFEKDDASSQNSTENDDDSLDHDSIEEELEKRFEKDLLKPTLFDDQKKKDMNSFGPLEPTSPTSSSSNPTTTTTTSTFGINPISDSNDTPAERTSSPQYQQQQPQHQHQHPQHQQHQQQQPQQQPQQQQPQQQPQQQQPQPQPQQQQQPQQHSIFDQQHHQSQQQQQQQQMWQQMWGQQPHNQSQQQSEQAYKYMLYQQQIMLQQKIVMFQQYISSITQQFQQLQLQPQNNQTQLQLQQLQQLQEHYTQQCMLHQQKLMQIQYQYTQFQPIQTPQSQQSQIQLFQHMLQQQQAQQQQQQAQQQVQQVQQVQQQQNYYLQQQQALLLQQQQQALLHQQQQQQQQQVEQSQPEEPLEQQTEEINIEEDENTVEQPQQPTTEQQTQVEQQTTSTTTYQQQQQDNEDEGVWTTSIKQNNQENKTTTTAHLSVQTEELKAPIDIEEEQEEASIQNAIEEINNNTIQTTTTNNTSTTTITNNNTTATTTTTTTTETNIISAANPWAPSESVVPKKKSLAEIQAEEREQKKREMEEAKIRNIENSKNHGSSNVMKWAGAGTPTWSVDLGVKSLSLKDIQEEERAREKKEQPIVDNASDFERKKPVSLSDVMREQAKEKEKKQQQEQLAQQQQQAQQEHQKSTFNASSPWSIDERKPNNNNNHSSYSPISINNNNNNNINNVSQPSQPSQPATLSSAAVNKMTSRPTDDFWSEHTTAKPSLSVRSNAPVQQQVGSFNEYPTLNILPNRQATIVSKHTPVSTLNKKPTTTTTVPGQARPDFIKWCHQQLKALTSNDVSVITELLCSMKTESEIRECAQECLGYSSEVNIFLNEYLLARSDEPGLAFESSSPVITIPAKKTNKSSQTNPSKTKKKK